MPQVDLETLVSACAGGGSDRKITCETLAEVHAGEDLPEKDDAPDLDVPLDFPPESFRISEDAKLDWFDRNAFFERKESTKGISISTNLNPNPSSNSNSQRYTTKASIIGLPKTQKPNYLDTKRRNNKPAYINLFPKRSHSDMKSAVSVVEPPSPKVSCIGRVRSKRSRRKSIEHSKRKERSMEKSISSRDKQGKGFCSVLFSMFRSGRRDRKTGGQEIGKKEKSSTVDEAPRKSITVRMRESPVCAEPVVDALALGGMKKFASGRRSGSMG